MPSSHIDPRSSYQNKTHSLNNSADDSLEHTLEILADTAIMGQAVFSDDENNNNEAPELVSSCSSEAGSEVPSEAGEVLFTPRLSVQRHELVLEFLQRKKVRSVLDLGCNNLKFFSLVKNLENLQYLAGVDIDTDILEEFKHLAQPTVCSWLEERAHSLLLELWSGDVTDNDGARVMEERVEAVTSIELIEHLEPDKIQSFVDTVLGVIRPEYWIVTTPNKDFNQLFPDWPGDEARRHWDHKFEWTRSEFRAWAASVVSKYPNYLNVQFNGVGYSEGHEDSHGPASQVVIFRSSGSWSEPGDYHPDQERQSQSSWRLLNNYLLPRKMDDRSRGEKIMSEVLYYAEELARTKKMLAMTTEPFEDLNEVFVTYEEILQFDPVKNLETNAEEIFEVLRKQTENDEEFDDQWQWSFTEEGVTITTFDAPEEEDISDSGEN